MTSTEAPAVLHVCAPAETGGLESVVRTLAAGQRATGQGVTVAAVVEPRDDRSDHPFVRRLVDQGISTRSVVVSARGYARERRLLREIIREVRPDVIHTHGYRTDLVDAPVAAQSGAARVSTVHGFTGGGPRNRLNEWLQRRALRRFEAVIAVSRPLRELLIEAGVPSERVSLVPNASEAPDLLPREEARRLLGIEARGVVLGWVGRLSDEKGPDLFIRAVAEIDTPDVVGVLVGDGPSRAALEELVRSLGAGERVRLVGAVPEAAALLGGFDLLVLSSRTEGTPIVLLEGMSAGRAIIATAVGGIPDAVGDGAALLVRPESPVDLTRAILELLADSERRGRLAAAARVRAATFTIPAWVARHRDVYQTALDRLRPA